MTWLHEASKYTTAAGHEGNILNTFLDEHAQDMERVERLIDEELSAYDTYQGIRFSMAGYVTSPSFNLDGYHRDAKITVCETLIDIEDPDWDAVIEEFTSKWHELESTGSVKDINAWYDEQNRYGWD